MQRVTMTIDDDLMDEPRSVYGGRRPSNRSEAVRDLVRAGLMKQPRTTWEATLHGRARLSLRS